MAVRYPKNVFLSYPKASVEFVRKVYNELKRQDIESWFYAEDFSSDPVNDLIRDAIDSARVCIIFHMPSEQTEYQKKEIEYALEIKKKDPSYVIIPVLLLSEGEDMDFPPETKKYRGYIFNKLNVHEKAMENLIERVRKIPLPLNLEPIFLRDDVIAPVENFTGRVKHLTDIHHFFEEEKISVVAIHGISGIGKTALARQYAAMYANKTHMLQCEGVGKNVRRGIHQEGILKKLEGSKFDDGDLLILDGLQEDRVLDEWTTRPKGLRILITSSNANIRPRGKKKISLDCFKDDEAINYLKKATSLEDVALLARIARKLHAFPKALYEAARVLRELEPLESEAIKMGEGAFKRVRDDICDAEEEENGSIALLCLVSALKECSDPIPHELFIQKLEVYEGVRPILPGNLHRGQTIGDLYSACIGEVGAKCRRSLERRSLFVDEEAGGRTVWHVLPLVRSVTHECFIAREDRRQWISCLVGVLTEALSGIIVQRNTSTDSTMVCERIEKHFNMTFGEIGSYTVKSLGFQYKLIPNDRFGTPILDVPEITSNSELIFSKTKPIIFISSILASQVSKSKEFHDRTISYAHLVLQKIPKEERVQINLENLAFLAHQCGEYWRKQLYHYKNLEKQKKISANDAEWLRAAYEITKEHWSDDGEEFIRSLENYALYLCSVRHYKDEGNLFKRLAEQPNIDEHENAPIIFHALGVAYYYKENYEEAESCWLHALKLFEYHGDEWGPYAETTRKNLRDIPCRNEGGEEARKLFGASLSITSLRIFYSSMMFRLLFAIVLGASVGCLMHESQRFGVSHAQIKAVIDLLMVLPSAFIHLMKMTLGLIIFCTLSVAVSRMGDGSKEAGKIGLWSVIVFGLVSIAALLFGQILGNAFHPGVGVQLDSSLGTDDPLKASVPTPSGFLLSIIPETGLGAFTQNNLLQVVLISILIGFGLRSQGGSAKPIIDGIDRFSKTMSNVMQLIMRTAPLAVFGSVCVTILQDKLEAIKSLGALVGTLYAGCGLFIALVFGGMAWWGGFNLWKFMLYIRDEIILVFGTASSEAALPRLIAKLEKLGCSPSSAGFAAPAGSSFNLAGSTLYLMLATLFVAQATNHALPLTTQWELFGFLFFTSKGMAGVTGASLAVFSSALMAFHISESWLPLILAVDRFMDMMRSVTNLIGNGVSALTIAKMTGELRSHDLLRMIGFTSFVDPVWGDAVHRISKRGTYFPEKNDSEAEMSWRS
jgi:aerobic C4-dicarboxylate transport protein